MTVLREVFAGHWLHFDDSGRPLPPVVPSAKEEKEFQEFFAMVKEKIR